MPSPPPGRVQLLLDILIAVPMLPWSVILIAQTRQTSVSSINVIFFSIGVKEKVDCHFFQISPLNIYLSLNFV